MWLRRSNTVPVTRMSPSAGGWIAIGPSRRLPFRFQPPGPIENGSRGPTRSPSRPARLRLLDESLDHRSTSATTAIAAPASHHQRRTTGVEGVTGIAE